MDSPALLTEPKVFLSSALLGSSIGIHGFQHFQCSAHETLCILSFSSMLCSLFCRRINKRSPFRLSIISFARCNILLCLCIHVGVSRDHRGPSPLSASCSTLKAPQLRTPNPSSDHGIRYAVTHWSTRAQDLHCMIAIVVYPMNFASCPGASASGDLRTCSAFFDNNNSPSGSIKKDSESSAEYHQPSICSTRFIPIPKCGAFKQSPAAASFINPKSPKCTNAMADSRTEDPFQIPSQIV